MVRIGRRSACVLGALAFVMLLPACPRTANVSEVYMALDSAGNRRRNIFFTDTQDIECVAEVGSGRRDATVRMQYRALQLYDFKANKLTDVDYVSYAAEFTPEPQNGPQYLPLKFFVADATGNPIEGVANPVGRWQCEVFLDGELAGSAVFNVQFPPDCPDKGLSTGAPCLQYFEPGRQCPVGGASAKETPPCTCDYAKGSWQC